MKHRHSIVVFVAAALLAASTVALAGVPDFVTYAGRLTDGTAWGQSQTVDLTFRIYDQPEGGQLLLEQVFKDAAIEDGYFSVMLTGVNEVFGAHEETWITVCVGTGCGPGDDLMPRQQVGSVPYALRAGNSELFEQKTLADLDDRYVLEQQGTDLFVDESGDTMSGSLSLPADGLAVGENQLVAKNGSVGIGTANPHCPLDLGESQGKKLAVFQNEQGTDFYGLGISPNYLELYAGALNDGEPQMVLDIDGNVGIGTTEPTANLHLKTSAACSGSAVLAIEAESPEGCPAYAKLVLTSSVGGTPGGATLGRWFDGELFLDNSAGRDDLVISPNGHVGMGTTSGDGQHRLWVNGSIKANGCTDCASDIRIKRNVLPISDALSKVLVLTGVSFEFEGTDYPDLDLPLGPQIGLIAQEVEEVMPEVVTSPPDGGLKSIKYANLVAVLIEAVKEQQGQIEELHAENEELRARLDRLEALVLDSAGQSGQSVRVPGSLR